MISAQAIHLGPIMLPWPLVIFSLSLVLAIAMAKQFSQRFTVSVENWHQFKDSIWQAIWIGLIIGRIVFVSMDLDYYRLHPIDIIKIQDKGFHFIAALLASTLWILWKNWKNTRYVSIIFLVCCFSFSSIGNWGYKKYQQQYQQFPQIELMDLQLKKHRLSSYIGQPTVINLWASWCPPCHREMPVLAMAQQRHPNVNFVMINQGEDPTTITQYLQDNQLQFKHILLDQEGLSAEKTGMYGLPSTLFFNAQGQLVDHHMGEISQSVLDQKLKKAQGKY
ncbi:TlpA disulfide reductase family protein [Acinetobacter rudis]|uniref:TlpA disulfide reductase family protein n=1 Tax=Acinetobacter rudis TaxID=632955 RepID=A0AAW8JCM2_9GAMM|nr:TlpA disulfide reductase family protein [Acinetobacter rudis]MDQ8936340.1 TlpA disulfide reductase family protein [Acinetobacter rudis]MDQ9018601.1 TlpA disulfide reductase family protein [Acinetobacter rudis]